MGVIAKYRLLKDLPFLSKGVIFEHREYDSKFPDRGNHGCGCLILGWIDGSCQGRWCGDTYIFPGQLAENKEWFEEIDESKKKRIDNLVSEIAKLKQQLDKLLC